MPYFTQYVSWRKALSLRRFASLKKPAIYTLVFLMLLPSAAPVVAAPSATSTSPGQGAAQQQQGGGIIPGDSSVPPPQTLSSSNDFSFTPNRDAVRSRLRVGVDDMSGAFKHSYPLTVPPGRNGMQPALSLSYNNQDTWGDGLFGHGWSVSIHSIERINRKGSEKLYDGNDDYFYSSLSGELEKIATGQYGPKVENGEFLKYAFSSNTWTVTDKSGTVYTFGPDITSRQADGTGTKIYKWMLQRIEDTNGNYVRYEYFKDAGQIYPSKIYYTGNGASDGIFEIEFLRQTRPDIITKYYPGFVVTTNYRINEIQAKVSGIWRRKYVLSYGTGDNGSRSLLTSITESAQGEDAVVTTLPATTFAYSASTKTWSTNASFPTHIVKGQWEAGTRLDDVTGDGLTDAVYSNDLTQTICPEAHINSFTTGGSWSLNQSYKLWDGTSEVCRRFAYVSGTPGADMGARLADINGDGYSDLLLAYHGWITNNTILREVYLNKKDGTGWLKSSVPDFGLFVSSDLDTGRRPADINGDGLVDLVRSLNDWRYGNPQVNQDAALNQGDSNGWLDQGLFLFPTTAPLTSIDINGSQHTEGQMTDTNVDGLPDIVWTSDTQNKKYVYLNKGDGTYAAPQNIFPEFINHSFGGARRIVDLNGDGIADVLRDNLSSNGTVRTTNTYLGTGSGWVQVSGYTFPDAFCDDRYEFGNPERCDNGVRHADINGDGLVDYVRGDNNGDIKYVKFRDGVVPDQLVTVHDQKGSETAVVYQPSAQYATGGQAANPNLPLTVQTAKQITVNDGRGNLSTTTYSYEGGSYYFNNSFDRKFAGFNKIIETDHGGNVTKTFYHQGNTTDSANGEFSDHVSKIGKPYRVEKYDNLGNLFSKTITKWENVLLGGNRHFVKKTQEINFSYDGDTDHRDTATTYTYDSTYGNLTQSKSWGEVTGADAGTFTDVGTDTFTTDIQYALNTGAYIVGLPKQETIIDNAAAKVAETKYYYDLQALGSVTDGNETKREMWVTGTTYIDTEKTYNTTYGIVTQEKDPRDKTSSYAYETNNLYPATVTNHLTQQTQYLYDYSSGKVKQVTDPNTRVFQTIYDPLDRVKEEKQPDKTTPSTLVTAATYAYNDTANPRSATKTIYLDATLTNDSVTYVDGLDRTLQTRTRSEAANTYSIKDIVYDALGHIQKESLPYFLTGSGFTSPTTNNALLTTYTYDALDRVKTAVNVVGTTSHAYDQWKETVTDAKGKIKDFTQDAYGNLVKVEEHDGVNVYTTTYTYNGLKNLTNITDALGNVRNFTYDGLGRRLTAQDLHASADASYGTWNYTYDAASNLTQQIDPKSQTVNFTYDDLNRAATEDFTGQTGTEVTYAYDTCTDGVGQLCTVTATANTAYTYYATGEVKTEQKTIDAINYTTTYSYDRQGNTTNIVYPDNSEVKYTYNAGSQIETVQKKDAGGSFTNVVVDFDYSPLGQVTYQEDANNTATTNTYDANELYRLRTKRTEYLGTFGMALMADPSQPRFSIAALEPQPTDTSNQEYLASNNTFVKPATSKNDIAITVGDATSDAASPQLRISRWDNEAAFTIRPHGNTPAQKGQKLSLENNVISFTTPQAEYRYYSIPPDNDHPDGAYEFEAVFAKKPQSNVVLFDIESNNLSFFYQPPLDQENQVTETVTCIPTACMNVSGNIVLTRPEHVVGSFAVYRRDKQGDYSSQGGYNYRSGKVFHIYRPKIKDATGAWTWGELKIDEQAGILSVTVPQAFLDAATYPVIVDPTFGYTTAGGSTNSQVGNSMWGSYFTSPSDAGGASIDKLSWYGRKWLSGGTVNVKGVTVLKSNLNILSNGIAPAISVNYNSGAGKWWDMAYTTKPTISASTDYVLMWVPANWVVPYYDTIYSLGRTDSSNSYLSPTNPTDASTVSKKWSVYATYTVASSNNAPTAPTFLLTEGQTNPTNITDTTPEFSAIYNDPDAGDIALYYQLQVTATSSDWANLTWDSTKTSMTATTQGTRSPDISYAGSTLTPGSTYYWRIKFWDDEGAQGAWSTETATFSLQNPPSGPKNIDLIQDVTYTYDVVGNITRIVDASQTTSAKTTDYVYDDLHRLTSATATNATSTSPGNYSHTYAYDAIGNVTNTFTMGTYLYQGNQGTNYANPHAVTSVGGVTYTYDNNGNLTNDGNWTQSWNYRNEVTQSQKTGTTVTYAYDHTGQRTKMVNGSSTTRYINKLYNTDGTKNVKHIYAGDQVIATLENTTLQYVHTDHLTGSNAVTNTSAGTVQLMDYYPYGVMRIDWQSGTFDEQRKFTGHEMDRATNLTYANARYYKHTIGRFLSEDPAFLAVGDGQMLKQKTGLELNQYLQNPQYLNSYSYSLNNPLIYRDPTGEFAGQFGSDMAGGQRQVSSFLHQAAGYTSNQGGLINKLSGFVTNSVADSIDNIANVFDPNASVGSRLLGLGLTALDVGSGGRSEVAKEGFRSFSAFKYALGKAGEGRQWHHIVEQGGKNALNFASEQLQNLHNIVSIPTDVHRKISGYYSSIRSFTEGQTVRQWLSTQSFEKQFEFGKEVLSKAAKGTEL